jgi:hypothetical protein
MNDFSAASTNVPPTCQATQERLSRFLDNDLNATDAGRIAGHLTQCSACRRHYDDLSKIKSALTTLPLPEAKIQEMARLRTFARLETATQRGENRVGRPLLSGGWFPAWRPAIATAGAMAIIVAGLLLPGSPLTTPFRQPDQSQNGKTGAMTDLLPDASEMNLLTRLHDAHSSTLSLEEPVAHRDRSANATAGLLEVADETAAGNL